MHYLMCMFNCMDISIPIQAFKTISNYFSSSQCLIPIIYIFSTYLFIALTRHRKVLNSLGVVGDTDVQAVCVICFIIHSSVKTGPYQQLQDAGVSYGKNKGC